MGIVIEGNTIVRGKLTMNEIDDPIYPMYLPLIGTGNSRTGLSHKDSLNLIKHTFMLNKDLIHQEINVVIWNKDKNKVSIWESKES